MTAFLTQTRYEIHQTINMYVLVHYIQNLYSTQYILLGARLL